MRDIMRIGSEMSQDFLSIIQSRGFVHQLTDEAGLRALLTTPGQRALYRLRLHRAQPACRLAGADHAPALVAEMRPHTNCFTRRRHHQDRRPVREGRDTPADYRRKIAENMAGIRTVFGKFIDFSAAVIVNNDDWLSVLSLRDMLELARYFSVNRMVKQKSVQLRLERDQEMRPARVQLQRHAGLRFRGTLSQPSLSRADGR